MSELILGPWPFGMDNVSSEMRLLRDDSGRVIAVRDAVNGDFDEAGDFSRRQGYALRHSSTNTHSVATIAGQTYCMTGDALNRVYIDGNTVSLTALGSMGSSSPTSYCELNGKVVIANNGGLKISNGLTLTDIAVPEPSAMTVLPHASGGLYECRYGVVVSHFRGQEESAASSLYMVDAVEGGGIRLTGLNHSLPLRVYRTNHNGDVLYWCADIPVGMTDYLIGAGKLGRACDTQHMSPMLPGHIVRHWNGRLLVARGRVLYFSEAMRYGIYSLRHGFVQFPFRLTMVQPVESGVWVGHAGGVQFLRGNSPTEWQLEDTGAYAPIPGTDTSIDSNVLGGELANGSYAALWLSTNGFVMGLSTGQLVEPQAKRIRLSASRGGIAVNDRRVTAIVQ